LAGLRNLQLLDLVRELSAHHLILNLLLVLRFVRLLGQ
jgi:hypothetical protein